MEQPQTEKWSGQLFGELGKLAFSDDGKPQCHLCGRYYRGVSNHVHKAHGVLADEYREIVGLNRITAMISEDVKARKREIGLNLYHVRKDGIADPKLREAVQKRLTREARSVNTRNNPRRLEFALNPPVMPEWAKLELAARNRTDEARQKTSIGLRGRKLSAESRSKISARLTEFYGSHPGTRTGTTASAETRAKQSATRKALFSAGLIKQRPPLSAESRIKISESLKAKYATEDAKNKIRESLAKTRAGLNSNK